MVLSNSPEGELGCDFDKDPTNLYLLIQNRDWEGVHYQAQHFPQEVKTFVFRKTEDGILKWRLLPLHGAILNDAPNDVLDTLINAYRLGTQKQDDHGMLPIHLAIKKHAAKEAINLLLAAYPECVDVKNYQGLTPYEMAQSSSSKHKDYYLRALKRGSPTYSAVTASLSDLLCGVSLPKLTSDPRTAFGMLAV